MRVSELQRRPERVPTVEFIAICPPLIKGNVGPADECKCAVANLPVQRRESLVYLSYAMTSYRVNEDSKREQTFFSNQLNQ